MKKILKKILANKKLSNVFMKYLLILNSSIYKIIDRLSIVLNNGIHPKHDIIRYKEWFLDQIESDWTVLDIGSNTGLMPFLLANKAKFVYGIEINEEYINEAKLNRQKPNIEYICAEATEYDFSKCNRVDCVTLSNVIEHVEKRVEFLQTLIKKLNWNEEDHKRFLFRVPMLDRDWLVIYRKEFGLDYRSDKTHFIEYTFEKFEDELLQAGIKILDFKIKFGEIYAVCEAMK